MIVKLMVAWLHKATDAGPEHARRELWTSAAERPRCALAGRRNLYYYPLQAEGTLAGEPRERAMRNLLSACVLVTAFASPAAADYRADCMDYENPDKAIRACTVMLQFEPQNPAPYAYRGSAYITKKDFDSAIRDLSEAIRLDKRAPSYVYGLRGAAYKAKGKIDQALADFDESIRLDASRANVYGLRGEIYEQRNDTDHALADFTRAIELEPKNPQRFLDRGNVRFSRKEFDGAVADFSAAIKLGPDFFDAYYNRALTYYYAAKPAAGLPDIDKALSLRPKDVDVIESRAMILERLGRTQEAVAGYRAALALDPSAKVSREALNRLGAAR
jgi:tetratricopeptide (TPR) repeat protein